MILRNWGAAFETAETITQRYPDRVGGFFALSSLEKSYSAPGRFALLVEEKHRPTLARLERELEQSREYSDDDVADLYSYALVLDDTAAVRRWRTRLVKEAPGHRVAREIRVLEILSQADERCHSKVC